MDDKKRLVLDTNEHYKESCLRIAEEKLSGYSSIEEIEKVIDDINIYPNLDGLQDPKDIFILDESTITDEEIDAAKDAVLKGEIFFEHACAGEATRLGIGTKYLLNLKELPVSQIAEMITKEKGEHVTEKQVIEEAKIDPKELADLPLGVRHMFQLSFDIKKLAQKRGKDPVDALSRQEMIVILNNKTDEEIIRTFIDNDFFGFQRDKVYFMVQKDYYGINIDKSGRPFFDGASEKRLHNHGQMVMQETMDKQVFHLEDDHKRKYLTAEEFGNVLKGKLDKISYNIEDLAYLTSSIDFLSLAIALKKGKEGFRMTMEIVGNNPENPQIGGMAAYDPRIGRNVMIELFQLKGMQGKDITFLNKNFNNYPYPYDSWKELKDKGLNMPLKVKKGFLYFQPVQGDINFLVKTEFVQRKVLKPIKAWKAPSTTPLAIEYSSVQDSQPGFLEYVESHRR